MRIIAHVAFFFGFMQAAHAQEVYIVQPSDTLRSIAVDQLGNISASAMICALNELDDCDRILVGQVLQLPQIDPVGDEPTLTSFLEIYSLDSELGLPLNPQGEISVVKTGAGVALSGYQPNASSALQTGGAYIRVTDAFEQAASGNMIRVDITVSGPEGGRFAAAYSTAEVGNSGWIIFQTASDAAVVSFEYFVPKMVDGNGDFLGILPDLEGTGQIITISEIRFLVVDQ